MLPVRNFFTHHFNKYDEATLWNNISNYHCIDEKSLCAELLLLPIVNTASQQTAQKWITDLRAEPTDDFSIQELMLQFGLESNEGVALMALAEALLRIPDDDTALALIQEKLSNLNSASLLQKVTDTNNTWLTGSAWGLLLSQQLFNSNTDSNSLIKGLWQRLGEKGVLSALKVAINILSQQFIFAETIQEALIQRNDYHNNTRFSFDMLGEAALCQKDVTHYFQAYLEAIQSVGEQSHPCESSVSIKLTALHPRIENLQQQQAEKKLLHRLFQLLVIARHHNVAITIDAEESFRLEISLSIFSQLLRSELCKGWGKLGLAVQAYSKRALPVLGWLENLARDTETEIPVRLVKGAYWDSEIKYAQKQGLADYPVFTQKNATDLSYTACTRFLFHENNRWLKPQFATHNALTIAEILALSQESKNKTTIEFQRLHGMADSLYLKVLPNSNINCRIYAPIGPQKTLLPYLVRRLLENGSNSSFMLRLQDKNLPIQQLTMSAQERLTDSPLRNSSIHLPADLYLPQRKNSTGTNLCSLASIDHWHSQLNQFKDTQWYSQPIINGEAVDGENLEPVYAPYQTDKITGYRSHSSDKQIKQAIGYAQSELKEWKNWPVNQRADVLKHYAQLLEDHKDELVTLCIYETGKTLIDAIDEVREAIDFCYYYAQQAETCLVEKVLPSITGEENTLSYSGRGVFLTISPWNFPLAIFTGQIAAALVAGNCVLAKPSTYSSLLAFRATELWFQTDLPPACLQLLPHIGGQQSDALFNDSRIAGVLFTGSTTTAGHINRQLAQRIGAPLPTLIAETGGQNAMVVDSSALIEQVIPDIIHSAFNSAGQRCSALRVVYIQHEIAEQVEEKLIGAMQELTIGSPLNLQTDIGPVINKGSMHKLFEHIEELRHQERIIYEMPLDDIHNNGFYVPPTLIRLHTLDELTEEHFGPVLHVIYYEKDTVDRVIYEINRCGYGLTLGIHSRNESFIQKISDQTDVGNIYINRDQVGAIVAAQPFGGVGLSGTGPKAGGPNYLFSLVREKTTTRNTAAVGGNLDLLIKEPRST